jgi:hypothetical protein
MGPTGLTAVFGMGTGVAPPVWSPECGRAAVRPRRSLGWFGGAFECWGRIRLAFGSAFPASMWVVGDESNLGGPLLVEQRESLFDLGMRDPPDRSGPRLSAAADRGGQAAWLLGPVGCGGRPPCTPGLSTW